MLKVVDLSELIPNALIELIENKKGTQISYKKAIEYGNVIIQKLNEKGIKAWLNITSEEKLKFEYLNSEYFDFLEVDGIHYVQISPNKTVEDLRNRYREMLGLEMLLTFTNIDALKVLDIDKKISSMIDNIQLNSLAQVRCVYNHQNKVNDNYAWNGYIYMNNASIKNGFEGIVEDEVNSIINEKSNKHYLLGKKGKSIFDFVIYSVNTIPIDYRLIKDIETGLYLGNWNYVDFYKRNTRFGGVAKLEFTELEDLKKQKELLEKVRKWHEFNKNNDYAVMIEEQNTGNKGNLEETFLKKSVNEAKKFLLK